MFNPGETVTHTFTIPFAIAEIDKVIVTYKQKEEVVFEKAITSGFSQEGTKTAFTIAFSQEESLIFLELHSYTAQLNVLTVGGSRFTSKLIKGKTGAQHHREVMTNGV